MQLFSMRFCYFFIKIPTRLISVTKIIEITFTMYQRLPKTRLCKEYIGRKASNAAGG